MKKIALFVAVVSAFSFASCKKDHTCTCTTGSSTSIITYTKCKKSDARSQCLSGTYTAGGTSSTRTCTFK